MRRLLPWVVAHVVVACAISSFAGDSGRWDFFHAEAVTSLNCTVQSVMQYPFGDKSAGYANWQAEASAKRNDKSLGDWEATIARFPSTLKGRHDAERACSRWMDEASKRVKAAR